MLSSFSSAPRWYKKKIPACDPAEAKAEAKDDAEEEETKWEEVVPEEKTLDGIRGSIE